MKGPKLDPPDGTTFDFEGVHFLTLSGTGLLSTGGPKLDPQDVESGAALEVPF